MSEKVCPYWVGYFLISPLRRFIQNPDKILGPHVKSGMTALDIGCGMGFFTLPLARMVGPNGRVVCVDIQEKMLRTLHRRASKAGVADRIIARLGNPNSLNLNEFDHQFDFGLAFAVVHEVPEVPLFFAEVSKAMKSGARCLLAEPTGRVSLEKFEATLSAAGEKGFMVVATPKIVRCHAAVLSKTST